MSKRQMFKMVEHQIRLTNSVLVIDFASKYSRTSTDRHLPVTATSPQPGMIFRPVRRCIHLLLLKPRYSGNLSTMATASKMRPQPSK